MKLLGEGRMWIVPEPKGLSSKELAVWAKEEGVSKMGKDNRLGPLSDKYLPDRLTKDLMEFYAVPDQFIQLWQSFLTAWKLGKTVANPATHGHNILSNSLVFSTLDKSSPLNPANWKHYKAAMKETATQTGADWRFLAENNVVGVGGRISQELQGIFDPSHESYLAFSDSKMKKIVRKGVTAAKDIYGAEDDLFKLASFKKKVSEGMSREDAVKAVREFLPDPARASKFAKVFRNIPLGSPFITFTDQALRVAGRAAKKRPIQLATIVLLPQLLNAMSRSWLGVNGTPEEELVGERTWAEPMLPWRNSKGRIETLDLRYIIPLANDVLPEQKGSSLRVPLVSTGPLADTAVEQLSGVERFTGRQFIKDDMKLGENLMARGKRAFSTLNPLPSLATYGVPSTINAASGNSERLLSRVIMQHLMGINIRTPHIAEKQVRKIAYGFLDVKDASQARELLRIWNEKYRPATLEKMDWSDVVKGWRSSGRADRNRAEEEAGRLLIKGDRHGAEQTIQEYNDERTGPSPNLTVKAAEAEAAKLRRKGVSR